MLFTMGKPKGSIGETKLKILAILHHNASGGIASYGYGVWKTMTTRYHTCLGDDGLRNIYHHLEDLRQRGLVTRGSHQPVKGVPPRRLYHLTEQGNRLRPKFDRYLTIIAATSAP
jgi:DNA-binding PadR family transcriptional regulator